MKLIDYSVRDFIKELDSASPAPGGGSASAFAATMGMALARMVGHLTIPKKKFKALDDAVQDKFIDIHESMRELERRTLELIDEDTEAFNLIMKAFKMPKDTDKDKATRKDAIEKATYKATEVPLEIARISYKILQDLEHIANYGNKHAISDVGVSALLLYSGLEGALLNVKINVPSLSDEAFVARVNEEIQKLSNEGKRLKEEILKTVEQNI